MDWNQYICFLKYINAFPPPSELDKKIISVLPLNMSKHSKSRKTCRKKYFSTAKLYKEYVMALAQMEIHVEKTKKPRTFELELELRHWKEKNQMVSNTSELELCHWKEKNQGQASC